MHDRRPPRNQTDLKDVGPSVFLMKTEQSTLSTLFGTGIRFGDAFSKDDEVPRKVSNGKLLETPRLGLQGSADRIGGQMLLVQGITVGDGDPTDRALLLWGIREVIQVQIHPVPFDDGKILIVIRGLKA